MTDRVDNLQTIKAALGPEQQTLLIHFIGDPTAQHHARAQGPCDFPQVATWGEVVRLCESEWPRLGSVVQQWQ